jgi:hypothetical protein
MRLPLTDGLFRQAGVLCSNSGHSQQLALLFDRLARAGQMRSLRSSRAQEPVVFIHGG